MSSETVKTTREGAVIVITLARADRMNALTLEMYDAMTAALEAAEADSTVRAAILRAEGRAFCAGNDLGDFVKNPPLTLDSPVFRFLTKILHFSKPLLAAVQGPAVGIGTTMLLHCDLVYAAEDAKFKLPFTQLALVPEAASSLILPRMVGRQTASELLFFGDAFDADMAAGMGLINEILPDAEQAQEAAMARAQRLAKMPPEAIRLTKQLIARNSVSEIEETMVHEAGWFQKRLQSPEFKEAVDAFFQKREPDFSQF